MKSLKAEKALHFAVAWIAVWVCSSATSASLDKSGVFLQLVRDACLDRGDRKEALRNLAQIRGWTAASSEELTKGGTPYSTMIGGWTFTSGGNAFAVMQSEFRAPHDGYVCSVTTKLSDRTVHAQIKSEFSEQFGTAISEELDNPRNHTDRYWISRNGKPPIKASLVFDRTSDTITIRMFHGRHYPVES